MDDDGPDRILWSVDHLRETVREGARTGGIARGRDSIVQGFMGALIVVAGTEAEAELRAGATERTTR